MIVNTLYGPEVIESRICLKCGVEKSLSEFTFREPKVGKSYRTECKECANKKIQLRARLMVENPRPTDSDYCCPICEKTEEELKSNNRWNDRSAWVLAHDHVTGEFIGWWCNNCNIGAGKFNDNPELLRKAADVIEGKNERSTIKNI